APHSRSADVIMTIGPARRTPAGLLPDAVKPRFHCARTHWIPGFMASQRARRTRNVMLMVPVGRESGFQQSAVRARPHLLSDSASQQRECGTQVEGVRCGWSKKGRLGPEGRA